MDRRRTVALIVGLVLCLALLGLWIVRVDKDAAPAGQPTTAAGSSTPNAVTAEVIQLAGKDSEDRGTSSPEASMGPGLFRGRIIDAATRQPVREFLVEFHPPRQAGRPEPPAPISRSFRTQDGRFEYRGLPIGTGTLFAMAAGYQRFDMTEVRISDSEQAREILMPMRAGHLVRGRVVDEITSDGIASATISFREAHVGRYEGNFRQRPSVLSGKDGSFALDGVPPGAIRIEVRASNYAAAEIETFVSAKTPPLKVALSKGGTVAGYLADVDGITPVAGKVSLANLDDNTAVTTATGSAGEFSFTRLSAGRYQLSGHGGGLHGQREIALSPNERLEGIVLPMSPGHSIRGLVSGLRPEERAGAYLYIFAEGSRSGLTQHADLDERGAYEVRGVAPGPVRIQVNAGARGVMTKVVQMPANGDLTVNLEFKPGARLSGRVTSGGKPLRGVLLNPQPSSPEGRDDLFLIPSVTSHEGEYSYEDVPDGQYVFTIDSYVSPIVRVAGDTVFDIEIPDVQLSGRVFEEGGKVPVVGATIDVRPTQPGSRANRLGDSSNNFGQFGIRGLQPGDFVLTAYKPGYELYRAPLSYGSPIADMTIHMRPARGVEIRVREANSNEAIGSIMAMEIVNGSPGIVMQLQPDRNGVSYIPSGLAGSSLRFTALGYHPLQIDAWNGQQLDLHLQREPLR